jgi:GNAT superfamily N-acetyltransferase
MASSLIRLRPAASGDVRRLVELNSAAYPDLVEDGVVFDASQLVAQQAVFPEGQIVLEDGGIILGAIATLIVPSARAAAAHDWVGITSFGTFASHEPSGDALYLADIYADPASRGRGVGARLYEALFQLCQRRGLARVVAGGRLWGYHEVMHRMSAEHYAAEVVAGRRTDRVLTSQLRAGFAMRGILTGYLEDWRSGGFATHLFWENGAPRSMGRWPHEDGVERRRDPGLVAPDDDGGRPRRPAG